jgi:glycosyltransferase involved in cell wall biosynthesis
MEIKISASLIVKNESAHLRHALDSILGVDEIVIVDTGSTDNTVEIAKEYTEKVYYGEEYLWKDDFAFHRNQSLDLCTHEWILIIDADEYLEQGGLDEIRRILKDMPPSCNSIDVNTISAIGNDSHRSVRVFKKSECRWMGKAHNYLTNTRPVKSNIMHYYGYSEAHKLDPDRTLRILTKACEENPKLTRERYYLAREYWYRHNYQDALFHYSIYLENSTFIAEIADAWLMKARCLWYLQKGEEARKACLNAIYFNPDFKEAFMFMSEMTYEPRKSIWKKHANNATNSGVLFIRST